MPLACGAGKTPEQRCAEPRGPGASALADGEDNLVGTLNPAKHTYSQSSHSFPRRGKAAVTTLRALTSWAFPDTAGWVGPGGLRQLSFLTRDRLCGIPASTPSRSGLLDSSFPGLRASQGRGRGKGQAARLPARRRPVTCHSTQIIQQIVIIAFLPLLGLSLHYFSRNKSRNQKRLGFVCTVCSCMVTGGHAGDTAGDGLPSWPLVS